MPKRAVAQRHAGLFARRQSCWVVQRYCATPATLDTAKFDLRLYLLLTAVDPPRAAPTASASVLSTT